MQRGSRDPVQCYNFALVVVQHPDGRFLLVNESRNRGWWLPGGRVEPGESFETAAYRETLEEGGVPITLKGILRIDHTPGAAYRMRVIYYAVPADDTPPKSVADEESVEARWVHYSDLAEYDKKAPFLRGSEPKDWFGYVVNGGTIHPLSLMAKEGTPPPATSTDKH